MLCFTIKTVSIAEYFFKIGETKKKNSNHCLRSISFEEQELAILQARTSLLHFSIYVRTYLRKKEGKKASCFPHDLGGANFSGNSVTAINPAPVSNRQDK